MIATLSGVPSTFGWCALAVLTLMTATWLLSVRLRNAGIVDIVWGLGFVVVGWTARLTSGGDDLRSNVLLAAVTVWGLRLSVYLWWRNHGKDEDFRYAAMRRKIGDEFWWRSYLTVFLLQGVLMLIVSMPLTFGMQDDDRGITAVIVGGVVVWTVGILFEGFGDAQLARFKRDPASKGQVMDRGLWRYTRHPNYFGDFCVWWGLYLVAAASATGRWAILGPIAMSTLLLRVSGVTLLEKGMSKRRPGYAEYVERTSAFFPRPPRS